MGRFSKQQDFSYFSLRIGSGSIRFLVSFLLFFFFVFFKHRDPVFQNLTKLLANVTLKFLFWNDIFAT